MSLLDKEPVKRVESFLTNFSTSMKVIILNSSARTAKDAAASLSCNEGAIIKSLLFRAKENFILCLISGDKRCSLSKLKNLKKINDISMATPEEVKAQTGFTIGGVSPIGHIKKVNTRMPFGASLVVTECPQHHFLNLTRAYRVSQLTDRSLDKSPGTC